MEISFSIPLDITCKLPVTTKHTVYVLNRRDSIWLKLEEIIELCNEGSFFYSCFSLTVSEIEIANNF